VTLASRAKVLFRLFSKEAEIEADDRPGRPAKHGDDKPRN
jgi:hypothetical protein